MPSESSVHSQVSIDQISENVYGHFAEHLGRCIYGGIQVGEDDDCVPTVELLAELDMPVLRWPGGCFADDYDWKGGGPREDRPTRRNL